MPTRTLDSIWAELEKAQADYEGYCAQHAETEGAYRKLGNRVRALRVEMGTLQAVLAPCIDCGAKGTAQICGPQIPGADPATPLGDYKIMCGAKLPDTTITLEDGTTQVLPGEKACRRIARGRTWEEALKRWDPIGAGAKAHTN